VTLTFLRYDLRENMNETAKETWDDEFTLGGVTKAPSRVVRPPRVAESPIHYECKTWSIIQVPGNSRVGCSDIVIGRVVSIHIKGDIITGDGLIDVLKARPLARLGYHQYTSIESIFEMCVPLMPDDTVGAAVLGGDKAKVEEEMVKKKKTWFGTAFAGA
jgi:flavin reductase (DIM6/NTAB) family NADH-FMN oxidoreductase RutF